LTRTYNDLAPTNGLFGLGWTSDLDEGIQINSNPTDGSVTYWDASGGAHLYLPNGSGGYLTPSGLFLTLVKNADNTYTLTSTGQEKTNFRADGVLTSIVDRNG